MSLDRSVTLLSVHGLVEARNTEGIKRPYRSPCFIFVETMAVRALASPTFLIGSCRSSSGITYEYSVVILVWGGSKFMLLPKAMCICATFAQEPPIRPCRPRYILPRHNLLWDVTSPRKAEDEMVRPLPRKAVGGRQKSRETGAYYSTGGQLRTGWFSPPGSMQHGHDTEF